MKTTLFLCLLVSRFAAAQDIALLDRGLKNPMTVTNQLTQEQLVSGQFPIYTADLDSVIRLTEALARYINTGAVQKACVQVFPVGRSYFAVTTQAGGAYSTYAIILNTLSGVMGATLEVVKQGAGNKKAMRQLQVFLDYLKNNRHIAAIER